MTKLYLDIETTGLSAKKHYPIIVGFLCGGLKQFIAGVDLKSEFIDYYITDNCIDELVGYNIIKFDLPFLMKTQTTEFDLLHDFKVTDLMIKCHEAKIYGGLKKTEKILGIERTNEPLNYFQLKALWNCWINNNDKDALNRLLAYNADDVVNLPKVEEALNKRKQESQESYNKFKKAYMENVKKKVSK